MVLKLSLKKFIIVPDRRFNVCDLHLFLDISVLNNCSLNAEDTLKTEEAYNA